MGGLRYGFLPSLTRHASFQGTTSPLESSESNPWKVYGQIAALRVSSDQIAIPDVLDRLKEMLSLLMDPAALQGLLDYEDKQFAKDLGQKLAHRQDALKSAIKGRVAACK